MLSFKKFISTVTQRMCRKLSTKLSPKRRFSLSSFSSGASTLAPSPDAQFPDAPPSPSNSYSSMRELVRRMAEHLASAKETVLFAANVYIDASEFADWATTCDTAIPQDTHDAVVAAADAASRQLDAAKRVYADLTAINKRVFILSYAECDDNLAECAELEKDTYCLAATITEDVAYTRYDMQDVQVIFSVQYVEARGGEAGYYH